MIVDSNFLNFLHSTFTVKRRTRTADGLGGYTITYPTVTTVIGKMDPLATVRELIVAGKFSGYITHVLYTKHGENILRDDVIEGEGRRVRVLGIKEPSELGHHLEIQCEEIQ